MQLVPPTTFEFICTPEEFESLSAFSAMLRTYCKKFPERHVNIDTCPPDCKCHKAGLAHGTRCDVPGAIEILNRIMDLVDD